MTFQQACAKTQKKSLIFVKVPVALVPFARFESQHPAHGWSKKAVSSQLFLTYAAGGVQTRAKNAVFKNHVLLLCKNVACKII